jgi:SAM-dependent methyltransferase
MLEIRAEFRSRQEWTTWLERHSAAFERWRAAVLGDVERHGVVEPISEVHHPPRAVVVNPANLRESISVEEMNGRKRAGLFALQLALRALPPGRRARPKILAAEAITRPARVLRGAFTYLLAAEYLPTPDEQAKHYPVPHLDLMQAAFPDAAFDLFYSGDVLEHVPDLDRALAEIARMLRPGGIMVSTFPFNPLAEETRRRASLDPEGRVIHHHAPEYHANPTRPQEGSLVYAAPGWDVLGKARAAGFADAKMTLVLSSTFGIAAAPVPGIFAMTAAKPGAEAARLPRQSFTYRGPSLRRVAGLLGIARSGTTLLCSILGVHSRIEAVYEPFNANKDRELPPRLGINRFFAEFPTRMGGKEVLLVKETGTQIAFLDRTAQLLRSIEPPIGVDLIVLLRNPLHTYLSMLDAQKKWWGGNHEISVASFQSWAHHNLAALARLLQMAREFNALIVSYESLVRDKERLVPSLMGQLGLEFEDRQLSFEQHVDRRQVRGDITIATAPFPVSDEGVQERAVQLAKVVDRIGQAPHYRRVTQVTELIASFEEMGIARFGTPAAQRVTEPLRELISLSQPRS